MDVRFSGLSNCGASSLLNHDQPKPASQIELSADFSATKALKALSKIGERGNTQLQIALHYQFLRQLPLNHRVFHTKALQSLANTQKLPDWAIDPSNEEIIKALGAPQREDYQTVFIESYASISKEEIEEFQKEDILPSIKELTREVAEAIDTQTPISEGVHAIVESYDYDTRESRMLMENLAKMVLAASEAEPVKFSGADRALMTLHPSFYPFLEEFSGQMGTAHRVHLSFLEVMESVASGCPVEIAPPARYDKLIQDQVPEMKIGESRPSTESQVVFQYLHHLITGKPLDLKLTKAPTSYIAKIGENEYWSDFKRLSQLIDKRIMRNPELVKVYWDSLSSSQQFSKDLATFHTIWVVPIMKRFIQVVKASVGQPDLAKTIQKLEGEILKEWEEEPSSYFCLKAEEVLKVVSKSIQYLAGSANVTFEKSDLGLIEKESSLFGFFQGLKQGLNLPDLSEGGLNDELVQIFVQQGDPQTVYENLVKPSMLSRIRWLFTKTSIQKLNQPKSIDQFVDSSLGKEVDEILLKTSLLNLAGGSQLKEAMLVRWGVLCKELGVDLSSYPERIHKGLMSLVGVTKGDLVPLIADGEKELFRLFGKDYQVHQDYWSKKEYYQTYVEIQTTLWFTVSALYFQGDLDNSEKAMISMIQSGKWGEIPEKYAKEKMSIFCHILGNLNKLSRNEKEVIIREPVMLSLRFFLGLPVRECLREPFYRFMLGQVPESAILKDHYEKRLAAYQGLECDVLTEKLERALKID